MGIGGVRVFLRYKVQEPVGGLLLAGQLSLTARNVGSPGSCHVGAYSDHYSITRSSPGRHGIALFFDRNSSSALAILLKSGTIQANQD